MSIPDPAQWSREGFIVTCDPRRVDRTFVAGFLQASYWAQGIPADTVNRSIDGSLCFALLTAGRQIGFARVISDRATIAYLGDVFITPEFRGRGLGKWLMECVLSHPQLQGLRRWILVTRDAHGLYRQLGFKALGRPEGFMELHRPDVYGAT
ncbi:MAG TPA: GNAT family N-acetyltransferase [Steroidobacteraceae bacterium]|nr:GNAT family N-acetyltransferase [Steroidobacteraceae bacterium]